MKPKAVVNFADKDLPDISNKKCSYDLTTMLKLIHAPTIELDVFSGDPTEFPYFMTTFARVVEHTVAHNCHYKDN